MRNIPITLYSGVNTATFTSAPKYVGQCVAASVTVVMGDTTAAGTVKLQGSNEAPAGATNVENYTPSAGSFKDIPNATSTVAAGVGPAIVLPTLNFQFVIAVYTVTTAGTSTALVSMSALAV